MVISDLVLFLGYFFLPGYKERDLVLCCLKGNSSGILIVVSMGGFHVKCISRDWSLRLRNGDDLEGAVNRVTGLKEAGCSLRVCFVLWKCR